MVTALNVANNILKRGFTENIDISPMKLQKLVYLVYKKYYHDTGKLLFGDAFEVWKYGPVVRSIYDEFKDFGGNAIRRYRKESNGRILAVDEKNAPAFKSCIDAIWGKYKLYGGIPLSALTHKKGSAWYKAYKRGDAYLSVEDIKEEEVFVE